MAGPERARSFFGTLLGQTPEEIVYPGTPPAPPVDLPNPYDWPRKVGDFLHSAVVGPDLSTPVPTPGQPGYDEARQRAPYEAAGGLLNTLFGGPEIKAGAKLASLPVIAGMRRMRPLQAADRAGGGGQIRLPGMRPPEQPSLPGLPPRVYEAPASTPAVRPAAPAPHPLLGHSVPAAERNLPSGTPDIWVPFPPRLSTGLPMDEISRQARATQAGFDPRWYYTQVRPEDVAPMMREGPNIGGRLPGSSSSTDIRVPHALFGKETPHNIFPPGAGPEGKDYQLAFRSRAQHPREFATEQDLVGFIRDEAPDYDEALGRLYSAQDQQDDYYARARAIFDAQGGFTPEQFAAHRQNQEIFRNARMEAAEMGRTLADQVFRRHGIDHVILDRDIGRFGDLGESTVRSHMFLRPEQLRSPNAVFDPRHRNRPGLLLSAGGAGVGASLLARQPGEDVGTPPPVTFPSLSGVRY